MYDISGAKATAGLKSNGEIVVTGDIYNEKYEEEMEQWKRDTIESFSKS